MRSVSILTVAALALLVSISARAEDGEQPTRKPDMVENIDEGADLPTTLGVGNDVHFSRPRQFRTDSFNSEHVDVEPLAADPPEHATPEP